MTINKLIALAEGDVTNSRGSDVASSVNELIGSQSGFDIVLLAGQSNMVGWDEGVDPILDAGSIAAAQIIKDVIDVNR